MTTCQRILVGAAVACVAAFGALARAEPPIGELLKLHTGDAEKYRIYRDAAHKQKLDISTKPVFNWTNVVGENTQFGHLFVWTWDGRPEVIGTIFSTRADDPSKRVVIHEFHTLSPTRLYPEVPPGNRYQWVPERGINLAPAAGAPAVAGSPAQRLVQMRGIARQFSAESRTREGQTWELRLLPTPLYQYKPASGAVLEGALFAMVSSAGTDPEVLLLIEARRPKKDEDWAWHAAAVRFSDKDLSVKYDGKPLWSSLDDDRYRAEIKDNYMLIETRDQTYKCGHSRVIDELPDADN